MTEKKIEETLVIIKPGFIINNKLIGKVISLFEENNFFVKKIKSLNIDQELAKEFYNEHKKRDFFNDLIKLLTRNTVIIIVLEGTDAVKRIREIVGSTNPILSSPGTLRRMYGENIESNGIHASDSIESANREISLFF